MIDEQQVSFYREQGYLVVENVLSGTELDALREERDRLVAAASSVTDSDQIYDLEETHTAELPRVRRIKEPHKVMSSVEAVMRHPSLVSILTRLLGDGVRFQTSKLNMKSAGFGAAVEWHQDWAFYPHTNDDLLAVGIMLDDVDDINGPLLAIPGSHRQDIIDHHADGYFCGAINPATSGVDFHSAVSMTGPAGSMTFHHARTIHGSALNRSDRSRNLLLFQYTAVDAWPLVEPVDDLAAYDSWIVAGEPTLTPRLANVPVRLPLPEAPNQGSIYENQKTFNSRFFEVYDEKTA